MNVSPPRLGSALLRRPLAALGATLLVIATALLLDPRVTDWATQLHSSTLDVLVGLINPIGSGVTLLAACLLLAVLCRALGRARLCEAAWAGVLAFTVAGLIEFGLKHLVGRPRPSHVGPWLAPELDSFPSGHATSVFAVATALASFYPALRWPLYVLAAAIALGRVYLGRHHLSDVVAGALIGLAIASLVIRSRHAAVAPAELSS